MNLLTAIAISFITVLPTLDDPSMVAGNGGMTIGVTPTGAITVCRWPRPSGNEQLGAGGAQWGVQAGGVTHWISRDEWTTEQSYSTYPVPTAETVSEHKKSELRVTQSAFVHAERDLLVWRIEVEGAETTPELVWYANFSPTSRHAPTLPWIDGAFEETTDFAAFVHPEKAWVVQFRPEGPSSLDWHDVRRELNDYETLDDWAQYKKGTWIAYGSLQSEGTATCGDAETLWGNPDSGTDRVVGNGAGLLRIRPDSANGKYFAEVLVGISGDAERATALLSLALKNGFPQLAEETGTIWAERLENAASPVADDVQLNALWKRSLLTLCVLTDRESGAVVRQVDRASPFARDWPRFSAWASLAYDAVGLTAAAERHALFHAKAIRDSTSLNAPTGSLPMALHGSGKEGMPSLGLDIEGTAVALWALQQHAERLYHNRRAEYLSSIREPVDRAASFLANWSTSRPRGLDSGFSLSAWRDAPAEHIDSLVKECLSAALWVAAELDSPRPEWAAAVDMLDGATKSPATPADVVRSQPTTSAWSLPQLAQLGDGTQLRLDLDEILSNGSWGEMSDSWQAAQILVTLGAAFGKE